MNESCHHEMSHMWMSVVPYIDESRTSLSQGIYYHVISHLWMSQVTEKWLTHGWIVSHIYLRHVTCETSHERARRKAYIIMSLMNGPCRCKMSHTWMRHVPYIDESCPIYDWVMSPVKRARHQAQMITSCLIHTVDMTCLISIYETWLIYIWDMTHLCVWHFAVTWLIHKVHMTWSMMTHLYMSHDSSIYETWLIFKVDMTWSFVLGHGLVSQVIHKIDMTWSFVITSCVPYEWVMSPQNVTHKDESCLIYRWVMSPVKRATNEPVVKQILSCHVSLMNKSCHCEISHPWMSHVPYIVGSCHWYCWVTSHILMSHVPYIVGSCPMYCLVMSHVLLSHVPCIVGSCPMYCWVMSHILMSHVPCIVGSCPIYCWVMSHILLGHVPYIVGSCPIYCWVMSHILMNHVPYIVESCPIYCWVMSHVLLGHVPYIDESSSIYCWVMSHILLGHVPYIVELCPIYCWECPIYWWVMSHILLGHVPYIV